MFDKKKYVHVYVSLILLWVSFLFKETGFFFLIFYPVAYFIYTKNFLKALKVNVPFIAYGILLIGLRINELLNPRGDAVNLVTSYFPRNSLDVVNSVHGRSLLDDLEEVVSPPELSAGIGCRPNGELASVEGR